MSAQKSLPDVGVRVFCLLQSGDYSVHWHEREVLDHCTVQVDGLGERQKIVVASPDDPQERIETFHYVLSDSDEGWHLRYNSKAILLDD